MPQQEAFPFYCNQEKLKKFLEEHIAIEDQEESLRIQKAVLREEYKEDFPMRAALAALKITRTRRKMERHPNTPMKREDLSTLEEFVDDFLEEKEQHEEAGDYVPSERVMKSARKLTAIPGVKIVAQDADSKIGF